MVCSHLHYPSPPCQPPARTGTAPQEMALLCCSVQWCLAINTPRHLQIHLRSLHHSLRDVQFSLIAYIYKALVVVFFTHPTYQMQLPAPPHIDMPHEERPAQGRCGGENTKEGLCAVRVLAQIALPVRVTLLVGLQYIVKSLELLHSEEAGEQVKDSVRHNSKEIEYFSTSIRITSHFIVALLNYRHSQQCGVECRANSCACVRCQNSTGQLAPFKAVFSPQFYELQKRSYCLQV